MATAFVVFTVLNFGMCTYIVAKLRQWRASVDRLQESQQQLMNEYEVLSGILIANSQVVESQEG